MASNAPDWLEVARTAIRVRSERAIIQDSDGNPSRLAFRDGAAEAAAGVASRALSPEGAVQAICDVLEQYQYPVLLPNETLRTS